MKKILTHILNFLDTQYWQERADNQFLEQSTDLVDLERRIKILENRHTQRNLTNVFNNTHYI